MKRLYIIVRADLEPGAQLAQGIHAASAFAVAYPEEHAAWAGGGGEATIVCLSARSLDHLEGLLELAHFHGVPHASFCEPDFEDELTAIALGAGAEKITSSLPLALRRARQAA